MKKPRLCMFCGKDSSFGPMDMEHFVPKCLWAGPRPTQTRTVPSHKACNSAFSDDNEYFRDTLVFEEGAGKHPEVQKLRKGQIARKFEHRFASIEKVLNGSRIVPIQTSSGLVVGSGPAFRLDRDRVDRVLHNVMKGIFYTVNRKPLPADWNWHVKQIEEINVVDFEEIFARMTPTWQSFGDDVFLCRYGFNLKNENMACLMQFYRHRIFVGWAYSDECQQRTFEAYVNSMLLPAQE